KTDANGNIIYDSNGEAICISGGWHYVSYCRARSCGGHAASTFSECGYYGHGVGMCQWGNYARGAAGASYQSILNSYYTGVTISGGSDPPTPTPTPTPIPVPRLLGPFLADVNRQPITLIWSNLGSGITYRSSISPVGGSAAIAQSDWQGSTSWKLPILLGIGWYTWIVQTSAGTSASGTLEVVPKVYEVYLPLTGNS
ncbi:MAG TPA: hypothetical protein VKX96_03775, partial [Chloroflexota bacterium]|nr:hypothetical protein [Chloroflexota bacterium]